MAGADGLGGSGANDSVFHGHAQPVVKPASSKPLAISSGVATGMLIKKTTPIYPLIARAARVSGTVELQATISKNGTIKDLHVVNGPDMLRQAAIDAVRTWRYKPYKLNNEPTEVETTIKVVFSLGG
jgi:protein TonB